MRAEFSINASTVRQRSLTGQNSCSSLSNVAVASGSRPQSQLCKVLNSFEYFSCRNCKISLLKSVINFPLSFFFFFFFLLMNDISYVFDIFIQSSLEARFRERILIFVVSGSASTILVFLGIFSSIFWRRSNNLKV